MSADHHNHSSLSIIVGDSQQVITGLHRETTVQNIVTWLCKTNNLQGEHLLLEVWKGCATPLRPWEKLVESILHWGAETHNVTLKLVKSKSFRKPLPHKRRIWLEKRRKLIQKKFDSCSLVAGTQKVAMRHSTRISSAHWKCHQRHKDLIKKRLQRMVKKSHDALKELQIQVKADERASSSSIGEKKTEAEAVSFLNPYLQGEYITSKNKLSKEKLMRKDLEKHKKELERKTSNIQSEILSLETNIEGTQEKVHILQFNVACLVGGDLHSNCSAEFLYIYITVHISDYIYIYIYLINNR